MNINIPRLMTIPQIAKTGLLPEHALRAMVRQGEIPAIYSGSKAFINFDNLCKKLEQMGAVEASNVNNISHQNKTKSHHYSLDTSRYRTEGEI